MIAEVAYDTERYGKRSLPFLLVPFCFALSLSTSIRRLVGYNQ